jgi:signal-transduction protein with cAMP-binding, CBS, and nucleotidyltransferase domain
MWGAVVKGGKVDIRGIIRKSDIERVDGSCTVAESLAKMVDRNVGSLIVKRASPHEPYGIVTRQDVLFKVIAKGIDLNAIKTEEIMSSPVVILNNIDLDVMYAAQAMANAGVTNLVIFDGGDVYGFLSSSDIITAVRRELVVKSLTSRSEDVAGGC